MSTPIFNTPKDAGELLVFIKNAFPPEYQGFAHMVIMATEQLTEERVKREYDTQMAAMDRFIEDNYL
jgi:hypothetical protein